MSQRRLNRELRERVGLSRVCAARLARVNRITLALFEADEAEVKDAEIRKRLDGLYRGLEALIESCNL